MKRFVKETHSPLLSDCRTRRHFEVGTVEPDDPTASYWFVDEVVEGERVSIVLCAENRRDAIELMFLNVSLNDKTRPTLTARVGRL